MVTDTTNWITHYNPQHEEILQLSDRSLNPQPSQQEKRVANPIHDKVISQSHP